MGRLKLHHSVVLMLTFKREQLPISAANYSVNDSVTQVPFYVGNLVQIWDCVIHYC